MNEWLPVLLGGPVLLALLWRRRPSERALRDDLVVRVAAQPVAPVTDAGPAPVFAVARALELDASQIAPGEGAAGKSWDAQALIRPLGLHIVELVRGDGARPRRTPRGLGHTELAGTRHGRKVVVRLDDETSTVHVDGRFPGFELRAGPAGWTDLEDAPTVVASWVEGLMPSTRWNGVVVQSGHDGLALRRPDESTRSWMHDLWLAEHLADAAACAVETERGQRRTRASRLRTGTPSSRVVPSGAAERPVAGLVGGRPMTPAV